jgi:heme o synthase
MDTALDQPIVAPRSTLGRTAAAYVALMKLRVVELLLVTTAPVMVLAHGGLPNLWLVIATLIGGTLAAGSANAFNMYLDRDIDRLMNRTRNRPLVTGELTDQQALAFAYGSGALAIAWLAVFTNWLAASLALAAILFYVILYTMVLKRRTEQNIIWGGIAGCFPVLIGWSAVTGSLDWAPIILFLVVFLWTPPHYWPLSMRYRDDYASASVPMLAVVRGGSVVGLQIILYAWATVAMSLILIPVADMGAIYSVAALGSGAWFIVESHRLYGRLVRHETAAPMRVFHASISYLTILFVAVGIDPLVPF